MSTRNQFDEEHGIRIPQGVISFGGPLLGAYRSYATGGRLTFFINDKPFFTIPGEVWINLPLDQTEPDHNAPAGCPECAHHLSLMPDLSYRKQ